jgi:hypothetical protein
MICFCCVELLRLLTQITLSAHEENLEPFGTVDFFKILNDHYDNLFGKLRLLTLYIRRRHSGVFTCNKRFVMAINVAPSSRQTEFVFLLGTYTTLSRSVVRTTTALQTDVFLLVIQFVHLEIFLETHF